MSILTTYSHTLSDRLRSTSLVFILVIVEVYFLINGSAHFPNWSESYSDIIMVYLIMVVAFMLFAGKKTEEEMDIPLTFALVNFIGFFLGTYFIMSFVSILSGDAPIPIARDMFWPTVILQVAVVATSEELMFRGVLLERFGIIISSLLFAIWHIAAYSLKFYDVSTISITTLIPFFVAFMMGVILATIVRQKKFGLPSSIAVHASYNLCVSSIFIPFMQIFMN